MIETRKSFCRFCHAFCGIEANVDANNNQIVAIRGDRENPASGGYTCSKGRAELERLYHQERLLSSKKRVNGVFTEIGPQQALDEIAQKLREIIAQHGPRSVAIYVGCPGHRNSASGPKFLRKWLDAIGSPGYYSAFTVDSPSLSIARGRFWGGPMPLNYFDIANADVAMFIGTNPLVSHLFTVMPQSNPFKLLRDARQRGMKMIVVDPRRCEVAKQADLHLQLKPGEDATLLAAMLKLVIEQKLFNQDYVAAYASGLEELHDAVRDFDLDYAARRTEVPANLIEAAAVMFATAKRGGIQTGTGLAMARHQNLSTQLAMSLNGLCGRYDRRGGLTSHPTVLAPPLADPPEAIPLPLFPGPVSRIRGIKMINNPMGIQEMPSNTLTDEILTPSDGQIRALFVNGGNPALVFPDEAGTVQALKSLDLLVVNDLFMSATAKFAHYVLACKHPFERTDVAWLMDGSYSLPFMQYSPPLVKPAAGLFHEFEIFWDLARQIGIDLDIPGIGMDRKPTADEMLNGLFADARIPLGEIRKHPGGHVFGERDPKVNCILPHMICHPDKRMALGHPEVIEELLEVRAEPIIESGGYEVGEKFAYRMITYRIGDVYCTQGQNLPSVQRRSSYNPVLMNARDMEDLDVKDGELVQIGNDFGRVEGIARATRDLNQGVIGLAHGWGDPSDNRDVREKGTNVQALIPDDYRYDRVTGLALMSAVPVNVTAVARRFAGAD